MKYEAKVEEITVDPTVLRAAANVLRDIASQLRQVDVDVAADTVPAARVFVGWRSGKALADLAEFWHREFVAMVGQLGRQGDDIAEAAVRYTAADQGAQARLVPVDPHYFRGR